MQQRQEELTFWAVREFSEVKAEKHCLWLDESDRAVPILVGKFMLCRQFKLCMLAQIRLHSQSTRLVSKADAVQPLRKYGCYRQAQSTQLLLATMRTRVIPVSQAWDSRATCNPLTPLVQPTPWPFFLSSERRVHYTPLCRKITIILGLIVRGLSLFDARNVLCFIFWFALLWYY